MPSVLALEYAKKSDDCNRGKCQKVPCAALWPFTVAASALRLK